MKMDGRGDRDGDEIRFFWNVEIIFAFREELGT
jgi:hypothetical protein